MKRLNSSHIILLLIFFLSILIILPLFMPGYFSHQDDLQVMRIFEMRKCLSDLQIPCRWVPDMGYGNGFPLFNYYSAFPYYLGGIFSFFTSFITAAKILFFIPLFFGGFTIYLLGKELFGKWGGFVTASLYIFAPYRALDAYVRGAIAESFALCLIPLVFFFSLKLIKENSFSREYFIGFSLSLAAFLTTHNIMTIMFMPVLFIWILFWILIDKNYKSIRFVLTSLLLGVGLACFFLLPAFFEKDLIRSDTLTRGDLNFRAQFVSINQIFIDRFWGYGAAASNSNDDTISYQLGWPHWWFAVAAFLISVFFGAQYLLRKRIDAKRLIFLNFFFFLVFIISVFMMHNKSAFVWERIGILQYAQFPWRFLSVAIFSSSLLGGFLITLFKGKVQIYLVSVIVFLTILLNWSFFHPGEYFYDLTDQQKLSGKLWDEQRKAALLDYLPKGAIEPREPPLGGPIRKTGYADISGYKSNSNSFAFKIKVEKDSKIEMPIFDFADWEVKANNRIIPHDHKNLLRRIEFNLKPGDYLIEGFFHNTPIRTISNSITFLSFICLLIIGFYGKLKFKKN